MFCYGRRVLKEAALRGYLLEECLAWLLRGSGYRLLLSAADDTEELEARGQELRVRGRGTSHQVDVLGELAFTPAFSLPVRLFLEAKFHRTPCDLKVVRNARGVVDDVNQNFTLLPGTGIRRPQRRFHYAYALFSAKGFTAEAEQYALAHQISLVDISVPSFEWLLDPVRRAAGRLFRCQDDYGIVRFPVSWLRVRLRALLGTVAAHELPNIGTDAQGFAAAAEQVLAELADSLHAHQQTQLLLGFPAAPFVLALSTQDKQAFRDFASTQPSHAVHIRRGGGVTGEWLVSPRSDPSAYQLAFTVPQQVEEWITDSEEERLARTRQIKAEMFSAITIYDNAEDTDDHLVYRLRYEPGALRRG